MNQLLSHGKGTEGQERENNMENPRIKELRKKTKEIQNNSTDGKSLTYEEMSAENERLRERVRYLTKVVAEMEEEKTKLKKEIFDLNDDVINSLVAERDEINECKFQYKHQLEECQRKMKKLEEKRDKENNKIEVKKRLINRREDLTNNECELQVSKKVETEPDTNKNNSKQDEISAVPSNVSPPASSCDSGIEMDIASLKDHFKSFKLDMERTIDILIDEKLEEKQLQIDHPKLSEQLAQVSVSHPIPDQYQLRMDRERNIIVHGLKEGETPDKDKIKEIFNAT